jgi:hypothetical protein
MLVLPPPRVGVGSAKSQRESLKAGGEAIEVHRIETAVRRIERTRGRIAGGRSVSHRYYPPNIATGTGRFGMRADRRQVSELSKVRCGPDLIILGPIMAIITCRAQADQTPGR